MAIDGWATSKSAGLVVVDIVPGNDEGARDNFSYLGTYSVSGDSRSHVPLWRYEWEGHPHEVPAALADDGTIAIGWTPDSRLAPVSVRHLGVTWLAPDGSIAATRRFSENASGFEESWERVRIAGGDSTRILFPQTGSFGAVERDGALSGLRNSPPLAVDIATTLSGTTVLRGWNGLDGTITAFRGGERLWHVRCDCRHSEGIAADDERVYVIEPTRSRLSTFSTETGARLSQTQFDLMPMDVAATGDGRVVIALERGGVRVIDGATLATLADWADASVVSIRAIAASKDYIAFLRSDGAAELRRADGQYLGRWDLGTGAVDVAFGGDSSLLVLDAEERMLDRYVVPPEETNNHDPGPPTTCTVRADKTARPQTVWIDEPVTVRISAVIDCPDLKPDVDVVIVWDAEQSWWYGYGWSRTQEAVRDLADLLISRSVRTAVIGGPSAAGVLSPFDAPRPDVNAAIDAAVRYDFDAADEPDLAALLDTSIEYMSVNNREDAVPILVLVGAFGASTEVSGAAEALAQLGGKIIALELPSTNSPLLRLLAGPATNWYRGVHIRDTAQIAERIREISEVRVARDVVVKDRLSDAVELVVGSPTDSPVVEGRDLTWAFPSSESLPPSLDFQVTPRRTGRHPTNEYGMLEFTEPDGTRARSELPIPWIDVRRRPPTTYGLYLPVAFAPDLF